ncbi:hypothetical protein B0H17DRAFT_1145121 [Mycena rosella]|uniref:Uncharacterized protein n=1 Tax=Mycena rosella TaxID=1033263 RepID=A0AAD7G258_MYCRO|nr:hypothetical protein B0H17DRAFT_1145121 [Mycena rosella]
MKNKQLKSHIITMQSSLVLNGAYCDLVCGQPAAQEESKKAKMKGQLVRDGMPRLLTSTEFVHRVVAFHDAAETKKLELAQSEAENWQADVKAWEAEHDRVKKLNKQPKWKKPVLKGQLFPPVLKPRYMVESSAVQNWMQSGNGSDSGSGSGSDSKSSSELEDEDEEG